MYLSQVLQRVFRIIAIAGVATTVIASGAAAIAFTDQSYFVPKGVVGKPYTHKFELRHGGGSPPYHYHIQSGKLPPGLRLSQDDGSITGTPREAGKWSIWLEGYDSGVEQGYPLKATQREFTFEILPELVITQGSEDHASAHCGLGHIAVGQALEPGLMNEPYRYKLAAEGGGKQVWSVGSGPGPLPTGMTLAPDGTLSGTPTKPGPWTFVVKVTDPEWDEYAVGVRQHMAGSRSDTRTLVLWIARIGILTPAGGIPALEVGKSMAEVKLTATGGEPPYTWGVTGDLPPGVTLDAAKGTISGTPSAAGSFPVVFSVKDSQPWPYGTARIVLDVKGK